MKKIMLCGGDLRQVNAANLLADNGFNVHFFKSPSASFLSDKVIICDECDFSGCDVVILPLPCSTDDVHLNCDSDEKPLLEDVFSQLTERHRVYGGRFTPYIKGLADRSGVLATDLLEDESFSIKNAYLTAEAAVKIALSESGEGILGAKILIVGFGRIGKCLAYLLKNMGADVSVSARKESDFAWMENFGYTPINTSEAPERAKDFDMIFNTVPVNIFKPSDLTDELLYIELASKPYGIDIESAKSYGRKALLAASLPGKHFPVAAGKIIAKTVLNLEKRGGR